MALVYSINNILQLLSSSEDEDLDKLTNNSQTLTKYNKTQEADRIAYKNEIQIRFAKKFASHFPTGDWKLVKLKARPKTPVDSESEDNSSSDESKEHVDKIAKDSGETVRVVEDNRSSDECNEHEDRIAKDPGKTVTVGRQKSNKTKEDKTNQYCERCNKSFRNLREYQAHQRDIHGEIYRCAVCNTNFEFRNDYHRHRREFHKNYICSICGRLFLLNCELRTHMVTHSRVKDICILCDKEFRNNRDYKAHMRNIHGTKDDKNICSICGKLFNSGLKRHMKTHSHMEMCTLCDKKFLNNRDYKEHMKNIHGTTDIKNICSICGKSFLQHWKLKRHMETHSHSKEFRYNRDYKEHMRHINETTDKKIDIDLKKASNKTLNEEKNAADNISRETLRRKQFKIIQNVQESQSATDGCDGKRDDDIKINIKTDQRNIHEESNFTCPICNRAFSRHYNMKCHMETHRIYRCVECNTNFEIPKDFNRHMREVHNNYACSMCGKLFFQYSRLTRHMETHSHMEMCTLCDKEFLNNRNYKEHMKNIHGQKN